MRLKKLELYGFKSFCDRTQITFQPGVTAVVGPNGCGKSNISDAILWVLGEQSPKTLRGERMEDVIFNGTSSRKPLGVAEVTLTIGDINKELDSGFGEYREVTVSRRLFRSGESEYLINKIPCRLKDIRDLLIDSGAGHKGHTIIEQGKVDQILHANPLQRREIIEETAGITKYKIRKAEALRKLDATEQNLLRVRDIISEIKRQINSLDRQAKKAAQYQTLQEELKGLEVSLAQRDYYSQGLTLKETTQNHEAVHREEEDFTVKLQSLEASVESQRVSQTEQAEKLKGLQQTLNETNGKIQKAEGRVELAQAQMNRWNEQEAETQSEIETMRGQTSTLLEEEQALSREAEQLQQELEHEMENLRTAEEAVHQREEELHRVQQELENERAAHLQGITVATQIKNQIAQDESRKRELNRLQEKLSREKAELEQQRTGLQAKIEENQSTRLTLDEKRGNIHQEEEGVKRNLQDLQNELKELNQKLHDKREALTLKRSRFHSLQELHRSLTGYQDGTRALIKQSEENSNPISVLAETIEVTPSYERAIEAVLGERLQGIQMEGQKDIQTAVTYLKAASAGRATFIIPRSDQPSLSPSNLPQEPGILGMAIDFVKTNEMLKPCVESLLQNIIIVDCLQTALKLHFEDGIQATFVSRDGDLVDSFGTVTGGSPTQTSAGLLQQKREMKDLESAIFIFEKELESLLGSQTEVSQKAESLMGQQGSLEQTQRNVEFELLTHEKDLGSLKQELDRIKRHSDILTAEEEANLQDQQTITSSLAEHQQQLNNNLQQQATREETIKTVQNNLSQFQIALGQASEELTINKVKTSTLKERYDHACKNHQRIQTSREQHRLQLQQKENSLAELSEKKRLTRQEQNDLEEQIGILAQERNEMQNRLQSEELVLTSIGENLDSSETQLRELRHRLNEISERKQEIELKLTELRLKREHLRGSILHEYSVDLETLPRPEDIETPVDGTQKARVQELKNKLIQIGPVNIMAIQEHQELEERFQFLTQQEADLTQAIDSLRQVIQKINRTTSQLFNETFTKVNEKFAYVFSSFFEGGKAELVLVELENATEPGVEIHAQPPGKRLRNLTLLSGGEKALTAIALLFATFLIHPSPFCLLDEIDAPLDEENIRRFTKVLLQMVSHSQFIVITHNKRTMEIAHALFGITMEEPGVSRLISVKLQEGLTTQSTTLEKSPVNA